MAGYGKFEYVNDRIFWAEYTLASRFPGLFLISGELRRNSTPIQVEKSFFPSNHEPDMTLLNTQTLPPAVGPCLRAIGYD